MNAESFSVKPPSPARPVSWKKICIGAFIILFVFGLIANGCNARTLKSAIFKELNRYMDVESVSVTEDEENRYSPNPQSKEHDVSFEAKLKDGTTITGSCVYNECHDLNYDLNQCFIWHVHIDGDRDWIGQSGSAFQKKPDKVDANTTSDNSVSIDQSGSGSLDSELKSAEQYLLDLHTNGLLPGCAKDEHGVMRIQTDQNSNSVSFPISVEFNLSNHGTTTTNNYIVVRSSSEQQWQLAKAWQTDHDGNTIVEWIPK